MAQSDKEKALKIVAKQIKQLDENLFALDALKCSVYLKQARENLFSMLNANGYKLDLNYKPIIK